MRTEMLSTAEEQRRGRKSEGLEITNFISFLLCCLGSIAENQCELCFPMLRVQVGSCVCASSQCQQVYVPGRELRQAVEDGQLDGTCMSSWWDGSGLCECPLSEEVSCGSLHSGCEGSPDLDTCPYRCSLLVLENSLRQTVGLYLSLL